jgi:hypothetical protein
MNKNKIPLWVEATRVTGITGNGNGFYVLLQIQK